MKNQLHTVLGSNGAVGQAVVQELQIRNLPYRETSRSNRGNSNISIQADLLKAEDCELAVKGSSHVYLCVGLPYDHKIWESEWEIIMQNVINACSLHNAKLIFLDNIYMYTSPLPVPFDENTKQEPSSKKGQVRKRIADMVIDAMREQSIEAVIGRSADFYGKGALNSVLYLTFIKRIVKGKNPQLLSLGKSKHTFANVNDLGRALIELALCGECSQQVWHLPVSTPTTMQEILSVINNKLNSNYEIKVMPSLLKKILSLFVPILKEALEMEYQFEQDYVMSDEKFMEKFPNFKVTSHEETVAEMIEWAKKVAK